MPRLLELAQLDGDIAARDFDRLALAMHLGEDGLKALNERQRARRGPAGGGKRRPSRRMARESVPPQGSSSSTAMPVETPSEPLPGADPAHLSCETTTAAQAAREARA